MELSKGKYVHSKLRFEPFYSQVPAVMRWNIKKPSTEGNNITTEAAFDPVPVPNLAALCLALLPMSLPEFLDFLFMNPNDPAWQILFVSFLQTMLQEFMGKLTEQIIEKV